MTDRLGQQLGNYRLTRPLGRGGFAEVYLGEHTLLSTTVAIKVLHAQVAQENVAQFQQEARLLASLKHPHIVRVLDFGIEEQTPYLVMDYASNGSLRTRHAKETQLPVSTVVDYIKQIAEALQYAHDRKIIHRDIKPENMLIGEKNEILLSDFGIALIAHTSQDLSTQNMAGTIAYMAPEQIKAHPRSASDQYSLGVVAYEWLCGTRPFHGTFTEIAIKHNLTPPPSPREHLPTLPPDVEYVILTALAKQPEERFASVTAFAKALEQASQNMLPTERLRPPDTSSPLHPPPPPPQPVAPLVTNTTRSHAPVSMSKLQTPSAQPEKTAGKPTISRRTVLIGATGVAAVGAIGIGVFAIAHPFSSGASGVTQSTSTATSQVPTATPQSQPFVYRGHSDLVMAVGWSPDGKQIASSSADHTVQVWNVRDGANIVTYRGHPEKVNALAWSPDGKSIASSSDDKTVQVWYVSNGGTALAYRGHSEGVWSIAWSPDGKRIASSSADGTVQVWNANDGNDVFTYRGHSGTVWSIALSPDGKRVASVSADKTVQVWNIADGSNIFTYRGHSDQVDAVVWSPLDGKQIASGSWDKTVQVWNANDGNLALTYQGHSDVVFRIAWSPDGKRIASGSVDHTVQVWNANDGNHVYTYRGHTNPVDALAWSPDAKRIASGAWDNTVRIWPVG